MFKVLAESTDDKIPTRVNHQLIYGDKISSSKLQSSINVSLINDSVYKPPSKKGFTWGQVLIDKFMGVGWVYVLMIIQEM